MAVFKSHPRIVNRHDPTIENWQPRFHAFTAETDPSLWRTDWAALDSWVNERLWIQIADPEATVRLIPALVILTRAVLLDRDADRVAHACGLPLRPVQLILASLCEETTRSARCSGMLAILARHADENEDEIDACLEIALDEFWSQQADALLEDQLMILSFGRRIHHELSVHHFDSRSTSQNR